MTSAKEEGVAVMTETVYGIREGRKRFRSPSTDGRARLRGMSIHDRLKRARKDAGYDTAAAAVRTFGFNENTYGANERGTAPYGREAAVRYARAFRVSVEWLLTGKGAMRPNRKEVRVVGIVGAGAAILPVDEGGFDPVTPPYGVPDDALAFVVRGDSQWPMYEDGTAVIAVRVDDVREVVGRRAIVTLSDQRRLLKTVQNGSRSGCYTLTSHNAPPLHDVEIVEAARVFGTVEP
jgi:phage repressor protein C with HTH and peptisase S24 domain